MLPRATAIALIVLLVPVLVYCVFAIIAGWKTMRKMRRPGWFIFIPYAPTIVFYGRCWRLGAFWRFLLASLMTTVSSTYLVPYLVASSPEMFNSASNTMILAALIMLIVSEVIVIVNFIRLQVHIAHAFGKSAGFAMGLLFLPGIFYLILGLSKMEYIGKQK